MKNNVSNLFPYDRDPMAVMRETNRRSQELRELRRQAALTKANKRRAVLEGSIRWLTCIALAAVGMLLLRV